MTVREARSYGPNSVPVSGLRLAGNVPSAAPSMPACRHLGSAGRAGRGRSAGRTLPRSDLDRSYARFCLLRLPAFFPNLRTSVKSPVLYRLWAPVSPDPRVEGDRALYIGGLPRLSACCLPAHRTVRLFSLSLRAPLAALYVPPLPDRCLSWRSLTSLLFQQPLLSLLFQRSPFSLFPEVSPLSCLCVLFVAEVSSLSPPPAGCLPSSLHTVSPLFPLSAVFPLCLSAFSPLSPRFPRSLYLRSLLTPFRPSLLAFYRPRTSVRAQANVDGREKFDSEIERDGCEER